MTFEELLASSSLGSEGAKHLQRRADRDALQRAITASDEAQAGVALAAAEDALRAGALDLASAELCYVRSKGGPEHKDRAALLLGVLARRLGDSVWAREWFEEAASSTNDDVVVAAITNLGGIDTPGESGQADAAVLNFSERERVILHGLLRGYSNQKIAEDNDLSEKTVKTYVSLMQAKFGAAIRDKFEAVLGGSDRQAGATRDRS